MVATGTPEEVAAVESSHTGRFLAELLEPAKSKRKDENPLLLDSGEVDDQAGR